MSENKNGNGNGSKDLFNRMVKGGQWTYFVSVRESAKGTKYITLTESKRVDNDKYERSRVFIFKNQVEGICKALQEAAEVVA